MRAGTFFLCFLFAIPLLSAVGFDIYFTYFRESDHPPETFQFSQVGWLWTTYSPDTYNWAKANVDPYFWENFVLPLLPREAALVAAVPAVALYLLLFIIKLIRAIPVGGFFSFMGIKKPEKKSSFSFEDKVGKPKERVKYKRK